MTIELSVLLYSLVLTFVLIGVPAFEAVYRNGALIMAGNRDSLPPPTVFNQRATRLRNNMLENMVLFLGVVLIAHAAGVSTRGTVLGVHLFLFGRIAHAVWYLGGWPLIRPVFWLIAVIGIAMVAWPLF